jgi:transposase
MPKPLLLDLCHKERRRLEEARDHHDKPYVRERATALLKIADGWSVREVALRGLLKQRKPDTVYDWFHRYQEEGFDGLFISEERGRKLAFSPERNWAQQVKQALLSVVRRDPWLLVEQTRWSLEAIRKRCLWLRVTTDSGLWRLLNRLGITTYKRGRHYTYSPDPDYQEKRDYIQGKLEWTRQEPERYAFLYQDECGYYRKPSLAEGYEAQGASQQPRARLGHAERTRHRVVGCLDALTGKVHFRQGPKIGTDQLTPV